MAQGEQKPADDKDSAGTSPSLTVISDRHLVENAKSIEIEFKNLQPQLRYDDLILASGR